VTGFITFAAVCLVAVDFFVGGSFMLDALSLLTSGFLTAVGCGNAVPRPGTVFVVARVGRALPAVVIGAALAPRDDARVAGVEVFDLVAIVRRLVGQEIEASC
jgi:hypothetical protein